MEHEDTTDSTSINYKANLGVTVMGRLWECDVKCLLRRRLCMVFFGERQMVIWLDSNSNLCEKKSSMEFFYFLDGFEKQKQKPHDQ